MEYRILGPLDVVDGAGTVPIGGGRQRALLAALLLSGGRAVSRERLIEDLWSTDRPESAAKMIQVYVSRLRKSLPEGTIQTKGSGYVLAVEPGSLDLDRFLELRAKGREALDGGRATEASRLLGEALAIWRGPALAEFDEPFARAEVARLEELWVSCVEDRIDADLARGAHAELVPELELLVARHPLRERLRAQLMRALYASGRQAEALASYRDARRVLDEELGIEPSQMLRELERGILRQDPVLLAPSEPAPAPARPSRSRAEGAPSRVFGRATELTRLREWLDDALDGRRRLVFVEGEPGSGKSSLLAALLEDEARDVDLRIGYGRCIEQRGAGEAYMPVFDALSRMSREPGGDAVVATLAKRAPTWLAQMPWLLGAEELTALRARAAGSTRDSMLREMVETLDAISQAAPVALVLDDLHWADHATLDLIEAIAIRDEPARLLVLGTYWRADAQARKHPVCTLIDELASRSRCVGFALRPLTDEAVEDYVAYRLAGARLPPTAASMLRERTGGNPLFLEHVVDDLIATGRARQENGTWRIDADSEELATGVPDSLRRLVEQDLLRLDEQDRRLVEAASVIGVEFSGIELAAALDASVASTEARAVELAGRGRLLDRGDPIELDAGTVSEQFRFKHELYKEVVYELLPASMRSAVHERLGAHFEQRHAAVPSAAAPKLAFHFARAKDHARAVRYGELAARQALDRRAPADAVRHLRAALDSLSTLGDSSDRVRYELELRLLLGQALVAEKGWSAPEAEAALVRARALAEELGDNEPLVTALLSLATLYEVRGDVSLALKLAEERLRLVPEATAQRELESNELLACTLLHQGAFARALEQAKLGMTLAQTQAGHYDTFPGTLGDNAGVSCHSWAACALWYLGRPDEALRRAQEAVRMAQDPQRQYSLATAQAQMALLHQCRQEPEATLEWADATIELASERGYAYRVATGMVLRGWALAALGDVDEGIDELERGLRASRATGAHLDDPHFLGLLADSHLRGRHAAAALAAVEEALEIAERRRSRSYQSELLRLRGAILRARGVSALEVEKELHEALAVARGQEARMLELRAATTLATVWHEDGRTREARSLLTSVYDAFVEGFETPDLRAAAELLDELTRTPVKPSAQRGSPIAAESTDIAVSSRAKHHRSPIRYTKSGGLSIAYQVTGGGPLDLVLVPGFVSHLEKDWDEPRHARFLDRLGSFTRLIRFDKRGTGLSDRPGDLPDLETRMDDVRAVMDAVGSERAVLFGYSEGGPMSILFAATYPERVHALVLYGTYARRVRADDYPWAATEEERMAYADQIEREWAWEADMRQMCPNADDAMALWWGERARAAASPGAARNLILMNSHIDVRDVLPAVHVRTLVLHRIHDPDAPVEGARYVAEHIPGARFVELPGVDHFVAMDPDQILDEVEEFITGARPVPQVHRVLGSILFSDIVGSTELARKLGDREWSDLLAQHDRAFHQMLGSFGGELVDTAGDGVLALFDGPARAIRGGLAVRDHLATLGLEVRVGIHTGEIERQGGTVRGIAVHLAARVAEIAQAGEVLVTSTTKDLVEGSGITFAEHGEWSFKGFDTARRVYAALSSS